MVAKVTKKFFFSALFPRPVCPQKYCDTCTRVRSSDDVNITHSLILIEPTRTLEAGMILIYQLKNSQALWRQCLPLVTIAIKYSQNTSLLLSRKTVSLLFQRMQMLMLEFIFFLANVKSNPWLVEERTTINRSHPSWLLPLYQNESKYEIIHMKTASSAYRFIFMQSKLNFI